MNLPIAPLRKRPITVTVAGERDTGKTTLIAVVAQALENAGHLVRKPDHVPNATQARAELREQFDVTFVEANGAGAGALARENEQLRASIADLRGQVAGLSAQIAHHRSGGHVRAFERQVANLTAANQRYAATDEQLRREVDRLTILNTALREANDEFAAVTADLREENKALRARLDPAAVKEAFHRAYALAHRATMITIARHDQKRKHDQMMADMRRQADDLTARADAELLQALGLPTEPTKQATFSPAVQRRALTLLEQAAAIDAGAAPEDAAAATYEAGETRAQTATDKLLAANAALMADEYPSFPFAKARLTADDQDTGC